MAGESLTPEQAELFCTYRQPNRRHIFLEVIERFIGSHTCERSELAGIYRACVERTGIVGAPTGRKRGRPRTGTNLPNRVATELVVSDLSRFNAGGPFELFERDLKEHGQFRGLSIAFCDTPAGRLLFLDQILLFIQDADSLELAAIRKLVAKRRKRQTHQRGRPDVQHDEKLMARAIQVVWMRHIERKSQRQVSEALRDYWHDSKLMTIRRLEDYAAAAVWNAIEDYAAANPDTYRVRTAGREIAPGALDHLRLQAYIRHRTGLPFDTRPEDCKRLVQALWPKGDKADTRQIVRRLSRRNTLQA